MRRRALQVGAPALIVLVAAGYLLWPQPPAWTIFHVPVAAGEPARWLMDGLDSREECETTARTLARAMPEETGRATLLCGYDCTLLRSRPFARYCTETGDAHEPG